MNPYELEAKGKLGVLDEGQLLKKVSNVAICYHFECLCLVYLSVCLVCPLFSKRDLSLNLNLVR